MLEVGTLSDTLALQYKQMPALVLQGIEWGEFQVLLDPRNAFFVSKLQFLFIFVIHVAKL